MWGSHHRSRTGGRRGLWQKSVIVFSFLVFPDNKRKKNEGVDNRLLYRINRIM